MPCELRDDYARQDAIPFESEREYMATLHEVDGEPQLLVKGAPDRLLEMCRRQRGDDGDEELEESIQEVDVFARAAPEHRLRLVEAMQAHGGVCAMTGDGAVNTLVMGSAAYLVNGRLLLESTLSLEGLFGSRPVWIAIGLIILLQLAFTYLPFLQPILGSAALGLEHWLVIVTASVAIYLIVELEKWALRWRTSQKGDKTGGSDTRDPKTGTE